MRLAVPIAAMMLSLCTAGLWLAAAAQSPPEPAHQDSVDPGALFSERCSACHTVPDPSLRTDRAWLDQIHRTA